METIAIVSMYTVLKTAKLATPNCRVLLYNRTVRAMRVALAGESGSRGKWGMHNRQPAVRLRPGEM